MNQPEPEPEPEHELACERADAEGCLRRSASSGTPPPHQICSLQLTNVFLLPLPSSKVITGNSPSRCGDIPHSPSHPFPLPNPLQGPRLQGQPPVCGGTLRSVPGSGPRALETGHVLEPSDGWRSPGAQPSWGLGWHPAPPA